jgi:hypothetical protein
MPKNCNAPFVMALALSGLLSYFAIVDINVRPAFMQIASNIITGYFALTVPLQDVKKD